MKDSEMRALVLQAFYNQRRAGWLGLGVNTGTPLKFDDRVPKEDVVFLADQLGDAGLIEWKPLSDHSGKLFAGAGKITGFGVDVIEGEQEAPIPIHIDQSSNVQHINISGQPVGVQIAGAKSQQHQNISQDIENLAKAIDAANVSDAEKSEAKSKLASFLKTSAAAEVIGQGTGALLKLLGV